MDQKVRDALSRGHVIDMTTTGRKTGEPRRIEIVFHNIGGRIVISGQPRPEERAWLGNLKANPHVTLHLKGSVSADVPATARVITDPTERREVLTEVAKNWKRNDVDVMVQQSPLIEVTPDDKAPDGVKPPLSRRARGSAGRGTDRAPRGTDRDAP